MEINSDIVIERVGDQWLALDNRDGVVHNLSGPAATVIDCVTTGQPIPAACDDAAATLVDTGILTPDIGWSRRKVLAVGATAAAVGLVTLTLPTAAMAASVSPFGTVTATAGINEVTIDWNAEIGTSYQVFYKASSLEDFASFGGSVSSGPVVVTGLVNGTAYDFFVQIVDSDPEINSSVVTATPTPDPAVGATWATATAPADSWLSVAHGDGVWVAVTGNVSATNQVIRSTDGGVTWNGVVAAQANGWQSVAYGNEVWVAVANSGDNRVMRSVDGGVTWTSPVTLPPADGWLSVAYGNGVWVAVNSSATNRVMRSEDDGVTWTSVDPGISGSWGRVAHGNGVWVAVASSGANRVMRSTNGGESWTAITPPEVMTWRSVAYGNGVWVAVSSAGATLESPRVMRSTNGGESWTAITPPQVMNWMSVAYGNGVWVAVADGALANNRVMRSTNGGESWTAITPPESNMWRSVASDGTAKFVAVSITGTNRVMLSPAPAP